MNVNNGIGDVVGEELGDGWPSTSYLTDVT